MIIDFTALEALVVELVVSRKSSMFEHHSRAPQPHQQRLDALVRAREQRALPTHPRHVDEMRHMPGSIAASVVRHAARALSRRTTRATRSTNRPLFERQMTTRVGAAPW